MKKKSLKTAVKTDIAVIGMGCIFPKSASLKDYWRLIFRGTDAIAEVPPTHWSPDDYFDSDPKKPDHIYCKTGGFLSPVSFDPTEFGIPPASLTATDTSQLLGLLAARAALDDAGYGGEKSFNHDKTSVILGVTGTQELVVPLSSRLGHPKWRKALEDSGVSKETTEAVIQRISDSYVPWQENSFPGLLGNVVAGRISNRLNLGGTNCVVDAACASSMGAVHTALMELLTHRSDMVITGGVDSLNDIFMHMCFSKTFILSPSGNAKPFSSDADGVVLGEGIGMLVLKRLDDAVRDNDHVYAVIKSIGTSSDGKSQSIYAPHAEGQAKALRMAYANAGIEPATVGLVEAHGTGTRVGDQVEFKALKTVFQDSRPEARNWCALGSVKSMIGHAKAASGAAGLIKAVLALHHKVLPPTLKVIEPDPGLGIDDSPFYLNTQTRPWVSRQDHPRRSGVSSFGFGGSNFHVVMEEFKPRKTEPSWDGSVEIFAFSADSAEKIVARLRKLQKKLRKPLSGPEIAVLAARSRADFSAAQACRLTFVLEESANPAVLVDQALEKLTAAGGKTAWTAKNIYYGCSEGTGGLALVFPGQGSQYTGMGRDLICTFPEALESLELADQTVDLPLNLSDVIFPRPCFSDKERQAQEKALRATDLAQPALGVVCLAMTRVLQRFGVSPEAACGHSYGELPALYAAGRLDADTLLRLSALRGRYMAAADRNGAMLAVKAPIDKLAKLVADSGLDVVLANRNSPLQGVLSGTAEAIEAAGELCRKNGFRSMPLPVSAAFHSRLVKDAQQPFMQSLRKIDIQTTEVPVFSNTTGSPYPDTPAEAEKLLGEQILRPVDFIGVITQMYDQGVRTFVEAGPKTVLTGLIRAILKGREFAAIPLDQSSGRQSGVGDLARSLAHLAALGHPVDLSGWETPVPAPRKQLMSVPISGANLTPTANSSATSAPSVPAAAQPETLRPHRPAPAPEIIAQPETAVAGPTLPEKRLSAEPFSNAPGKTPSTPCDPSAMNNNDPNLIQDTLQIVREGLASMENLQRQTAEAHQKFLETQTQASRTLQEMMESTRLLTQAALGVSPADRPVAPVGGFPEPAAVVGKKPAKRPEPAIVPGEDAVSAPVDPIPTAKRVEQKPPAPARAAGKIDTAMLQVVSDLTGYPVEMLAMDMDIEADLGIDSIKRVEILSTIEEKMPGLPPVAPETMGRLKTLGQIAEHLSGGAADTDAPPAPPAVPAADSSSGDIAPAMLQVVSDLTGYPVEMLAMDMDIEADLGIDSIKRVEILSTIEEKMPGLPPVAPETMGRLKTLGQIAGYLSGSTADAGPRTAAPPVPAADSSSGDIAPAMLQVVSDLTGYPVEMLAMDMDIEADLGIDSIKRVEILSTIEEKMPGLPPVSPDIMGNLKTLGQIAGYLSGSAPGQSTVSANTVAPSSENTGTTDRQTATPAKRTAAAENASNPVQRQVITVHQTPFTDHGKITIPPDRNILITPDGAGLAQSLVERFHSEGINALIVPAEAPDADLFAGAAGLVLLPPAPGCDARFLKQAFALARRCAPALIRAAAEGGAFFASATRLDGAFGFNSGPITDPFQGGLAGLVKTAALEWPDVGCRALDIAPDWTDSPAVADSVARELLDRDPLPAIEIGLTPDARLTLSLDPAPPSGESLRMGPDEVIVISGGARGVTAATALALARQGTPRLALLGRSPLPAAEPEWLTSLRDEGAIKKALLAHEFSGRRVSPAALEKRFKGCMAAREIEKNLTAIRSAGAEVSYYAADVRDLQSVQTAIADVRQRYGPITGIVHGAGVLEDRLILEKTAEQFNRVFDTKVNGFSNLIEAAGNEPLRHIVLFSSVAARMGNQGQADYAAANEVLNKMARREAARRPDCRVVAVNWGPWDGGMVSAALKREFVKRGIDLIPVDAGTLALLAEMGRTGDAPVEVVIGAGLLPAGKNCATHSEPPAAGKPAGPKNRPLALTFQREIDTRQYPILNSHILDGKPVVPFALMAEWLGHGALHENPGLFLCGIEDMRLLKGITLDQETKIVRLMAGKARKKGKYWEVDVEIRDGVKHKRDVVHSRARAILTDAPGRPSVFKHPELLSENGYRRSPREIYDKILFHGMDLHGIEKVVRCTEKDMVARLASAPSPSNWMTEPLRSTWIGDPLVLDSAFQMASLWCFEEKGMVSLPSYTASYRQYCTAFPAGGITALLQIKQAGDYKMTGDFSLMDAENRVLARLEGYEAVMDRTLFRAFKPCYADKN